MSIGLAIAVFAAHDVAGGLMSGCADGRDDKPCFDAMLAASSAVADAVGRGVCERAAAMYASHGGSQQETTKMRDRRSWWHTVVPRGAVEGSPAARQHWGAARRYAVPGRVHVMGTEALVCGDATKRPTAYGGNHIADQYAATKYTDDGAHEAGRVDASVAAALVADATVLLVPHGSLDIRGSSGYDLVLRHCLGAYAALRRGRASRLHIVEVRAPLNDTDVRDAPVCISGAGGIHKTIADVLNSFVKLGLLSFATHSVTVAGVARGVPAPSHGKAKAVVAAEHPENGGWWPWVSTADAAATPDPNAAAAADEGATTPLALRPVTPHSPVVCTVAAAVVADLIATVPLPHDSAPPTPPPAHAASSAASDEAGATKGDASACTTTARGLPAFGTCPYEAYATGPHAFLTAHLAWQRAFECATDGDHSAAAPDDDGADNDAAAQTSVTTTPPPAVTPAMAKRKAKGHLMATHRELADRRSYATRVVLLKTAPRGLLWFYVLQGTVRRGDALCFAADPMRTQFVVGSMRHAPSAASADTESDGDVDAAVPGDIVTVCAAVVTAQDASAAAGAGGDVKDASVADAKELHAALREQSQWSIAGEATLEGFPAVEALLRFTVHPLSVLRQKKWIGKSVAVTGYGGTSHGVVVSSGVMANGKTGELLVKVLHFDAKAVLVGHRHGLRTYPTSWVGALRKVGSSLVDVDDSAPYPPHAMVLRIETLATSKQALAVGKLTASYGYLEMARLFAVLGRAGPAAVDAAVPDVETRLAMWRDLWTIDPSAPSNVRRNPKLVQPQGSSTEPAPPSTAATTRPAFPVARISGTNVVCNHQTADTYQSNMALCLLSDAHAIMENMNAAIFRCGDGKSTTLFRLVGAAFGIDAYRLALEDACCTLDLTNHRSWLPQNLPPCGSSLRMSTTKIGTGRESLRAVKEPWTSKAWTSHLITTGFSHASILAATTAYNSTSMPNREYQNIVFAMIRREDFLDALHVMGAVPDKTTQNSNFLAQLAVLSPKLPDTFLYHLVIRNPTDMCDRKDFIDKAKWALPNAKSWQWQHFAAMQAAIRRTSKRDVSDRFVMYAYFVGTVLMAAERRLYRIRSGGQQASAAAPLRAPGIVGKFLAGMNDTTWEDRAKVPRGPVFSIAEVIASFIVLPR